MVNNFIKNKNSKLFYRRKFEMGYNFWIQDEFIDIDNFIKFMDIKKDEELTEEELRLIISINCNKKLPQNHEFSWEVLISPKPCSFDGKLQYPVSFLYSLTFPHPLPNFLFFSDSLTNSSCTW